MYANKKNIHGKIKYKYSVKFDEDRYLKVVSEISKTENAKRNIILLFLKYLVSFFGKTIRKQQTIVINEI